MKKYLVYGMMGAVALTFTACSTSDEDLALQDNLEKGVVKTEFNITIPGKMNTRMSEATTQAQSPVSFRGMSNINLIPFSKAGQITDGKVTNSEYVIGTADGRLGAKLQLLKTDGKSSPQISTDYSIATSLTNRQNLSQVYKDVEVPIGTQSFLFYGEATALTAMTPATTDEVNGKLTATGLDSNTPAGISFALGQIATSSDNSYKTNILAYLNSIVDAGDWKTEGKELHEVFTQFTSNHAGSSANVQALVQDLYTALLPYTSTNAVAVKNAITNSTYASAGAEGKLTFVGAQLGDPDNSDFTKSFPGVLYLPDGAAYISYNATDGKFVYVDTEDNVNNVAKLTDYVYPASLYYRANSTVSVANTSLLETYENTNNSWSDVLGAYTSADGGKAHGAVSAETKSVAVEDQIQYAVGRMDLSVSAAATLNDNENKGFTVADNNFTVTGVLIGGQKPVDYLFVPKTGESVKEVTIWDNQLEASKNLSTTSTLVNRTLVLETASSAKIKFAIEFLNNSGKDFVSETGIVPAGCKFYLVGEIDPATVGTGGAQKQYVRAHNTIDADGKAVAKTTSDNIDQVFVQDYVTAVTATVSSLKKAYNVIPDLRTPQLEIGLSVNLTWEAANTYSVTLE